MNNQKLRKHAKEMQNKALDMFLDENASLNTIDQIYKMLEVSEMVLEITEETTEESDDAIKDELMGAEKYLEMYSKTNDAEYLSMAKDEAKHAKKLILIAKSKGEDITSSMSWYDSIINRANSNSNNYM